ncbi:Exoribonuclease, phosphorolytic domain 1,Exoribonuclease, phosphorolytic domain 2,Ribosomal [Cinara cedri]|uniref:Exoribonuclease, phosphorolytic domain 1,Exoribonuclease, phosphorolytic domain 2,Ribosomal n=1 Tax=Cinara cedri TaxID=506608 RepID=A0A5E4NTF9_9HEMI|nr:Exoribonuclease, phosphorolytic domain 1,Exoribonuclease, phosphorolytic domain 2,Ribosomal [Cinara cedri]
MPTNVYRIQGPEGTIPYQQYLINKKNTKLNDISKALIKNVRYDGRDFLTHRQLCIKTGIVTQAKGSAYVECGHTKLVCSVFDPKEVPNKVEYAKTGELQCEFKFATFSCRQRRNYMRDPEERQLCNELRRALEPAICRGEFANFEIQINVLVLENDGSVLATAITAAGLALMDGCIPMYDVIVATSLGIYKNKILVDPTFDEETLCSTITEKEENRGTVMLAYMKNIQQITDFAQNGSINVNMFPEYVQTLIDQNCQLYKIVVSAARNDVIDYFENESQ